MNTISVHIIDILSFSSHISSTLNEDGSDNEDGIENLSNSLDIMEYFLRPDENDEDNEHVRVTQFSDSIVLSFDYMQDSQLFYRFLSIQWMLLNLILRGIICRGGISVGKIIHTDKYIFGPALVKAYKMESEAALYPRVIVPEELVMLAKKYNSSHSTSEEEMFYVFSLLDRDSDGLFFIDYFYSALSELDDRVLETPMYVNALYKIISRGLESIEPGVNVKYRWMKEKYNDMVRLIKKKIPKNGNYTGDYDVDESYRSLRMIE